MSLLDLSTENTKLTPVATRWDFACITLSLRLFFAEILNMALFKKGGDMVRQNQNVVIDEDHCNDVTYSDAICIF